MANHETLPDNLRSLLPRFRGRVFFLTGAGVSAASGIQTFRGDEGLYKGLDPYQLASPEGFAADPVTVWNWYLMRIHRGKHAEPNAGHLALARMETLAAEFHMVTSNVDHLHMKAGSQKVYRVHGNVLEMRCTECRRITPVDPHAIPEEIDAETIFRCELDGALLRPNVVWFGERANPQVFDIVNRHLPDADVLIEAGMSGMVDYGMTQLAARMGIPVLRINPEGEGGTGIYIWRERSEVALPLLVEEAAAATLSS